MNSQKDSMMGGVLMLVGLVVLLTVPMIIGHYVSAQTPAPTVTAAVNQ